MSQHFTDFPATDEWQDIAAGAAYAGVINQTVTIQNKGIRRALVWFGGAAAPADAGAGAYLSINDAISGTSDHIWVKGRGALAIWKED